MESARQTRWTVYCPTTHPYGMAVYPIHTENSLLVNTKQLKNSQMTLSLVFSDFYLEEGMVGDRVSLCSPGCEIKQGRALEGRALEDTLEALKVRWNY